MSDLQNPLFEEEKEFLERKKLEYERALRGDVEQIKEKSTQVGKVALVGAGLAGGIWLITKAFGGKKRKKRYGKRSDDKYSSYDPDFDANDEPEHDFSQYDEDVDQDQDDDFDDAQYFTAGNGKRYKSKTSYKSAAASADVFRAQPDQDEEYQPEQERETDDFGFGSTPAAKSHDVGYSHTEDEYREPSPFDTEEFEDDPFQDLPYDDSRRLPASHAFDEANGPANSASSARSKMVGSVLKAFLQSDTGKVLVGQVAAVGLALVTKKVSEFFPASKNPDLATSPGYAPAETGFSPVPAPAPAASSVSLDSPDASTHSQSI